jgi:hypothetical protein
MNYQHKLTRPNLNYSLRNNYPITVLADTAEQRGHGWGVGGSDLCTHQLSPLYHLEDGTEKVNLNRNNG